MRQNSTYKETMPALKRHLTMVSALSLLCLTACQTTSQHASSTQTDSEIDAIDRALSQAVATAAMSGDKEKSFALLERLYTRNSDDPKMALLYAQALRKENRLTRAALVIAPHANNPKTPSAFKGPLLTEYATLLAAMGDYSKAEYYARQAVMEAPEQGRPYHVLGLSLDAQGHHEEAEVALRKAIDRWSGDPTPVLNNLGLNLAAQGFLDDAVEILRKAKAAAPNREEIERNLRIVLALYTTPPKEHSSLEWPRLVVMPPEPKPDHKKEDAAVEGASVLEIEEPAPEVEAKGPEDRTAGHGMPVVIPPRKVKIKSLPEDNDDMPEAMTEAKVVIKTEEKSPSPAENAAAASETNEPQKDRYVGKPRAVPPSFND